MHYFQARNKNLLIFKKAEWLILLKPFIKVNERRFRMFIIKLESPKRPSF